MIGAMILCAGLGTRLRPLTTWSAKPMVPIGDMPAVGHIATHLRLAGVSQLVVNVHHRPGDLRAWAEREGVAVSEEPELLGTAGGLSRAASLLGEGDVLAWNGDTLSELDVGALVAAHEASAPAATLAVVPRAGREGNVGVGTGGEIVRLRGETHGREIASADFTGIHVVGRAARLALPARGCLVGDVYLPALRRGMPLRTHIVEREFVDIGTVERYAAANRRWLATRGATSWVSPSATVHADVEGSVVGAGALVEADARRCIVWPGAHVARPVEDAIVTPRGIVVLSS